MSAGTHSRHAWGDESALVCGRDDDLYLMGAVIAAESDAPLLTEALRGLLLPGQKKVHWHSDDKDRHDLVVATISELPIQSVIVVRRSPRTDRDERRRRKCFERLAPLVALLGCEGLTLESRGAKADQRDRNMLDALRAQQLIGGLRLTHTPGPADPILWIADAVLGVVVADRAGNSRWRDRVECAIDVYEYDDRK